MRQVSITGMIVSKNGVTVFLHDGSSEVLAQSGWRTKEIVTQIAMHNIENPETPFSCDLDSFTANGIINTAGASLGVKIETTGEESVAVVKNQVTGEEKKIEIGSELAQHIEEAAYGDGAKGLALFLQHFADHQCPHGSKELLAFMKRSDLPIADDGMIVAYKILNKSQLPEMIEGDLVDPHTRKVRQRLGSLVESGNCDPNSRRLCSTGLHVCYKDYVSSFGGEVLTLIKIAPEDCIAHDVNQHKMRVRKYHIVAILPDKSYKDICSGKSARDEEGHDVLAKVVAGDHPAVLEHVLIKGERGNDIVYTTMTPAPVVSTENVKTRSMKRREVKLQKVTPQDVKKLAAAAKAKEDIKKPKKVAPEHMPFSKVAKEMAEKTKKAVLSEFEQKVKKALQMVKVQGLSIRAVAKELHMDRDVISAFVSGKRVLPA